MKRLTFFALLTALFVCGASAQVHNSATVEIISLNPGADPFLCVFANSIDDVCLIDYHLNLDGKEVQYLREREEEADLALPFTREMGRLNVRFMSIHIYQRRFDSIVGFVPYWIVDIIERVGNKYYRVATNNY